MNGTFKGTFDEERHLCFTEAGLWMPSTTQVIQAQGLSPDFKKYVAEDVLDRSCKIGTEVHWLTDIYDEFGDVDNSWLHDGVKGFYESYLGFRAISGFKPTAWSVRRFSILNGFHITGESDKEGTMGGMDAILDLKTGSGNPPYWGIQSGSYEMQKYGVPRVGRCIRAVCKLFANGKAGKLHFHENHGEDEQQFLSALCNAHYRIKAGYLTPSDFV